MTIRPVPRSASAIQCPHRAALCASSIPSEGSPPLKSNPTLEYSTGNVVLCWQPFHFFAMDSLGVCRRRRFLFLRRAIYDGRKSTPPPQPPCTGAHTERVGTPIAQSHRTERPGFRQCHLRAGTRKTSFSLGFLPSFCKRRR